MLKRFAVNCCYWAKKRWMNQTRPRSAGNRVLKKSPYPTLKTSRPASWPTLVGWGGPSGKRRIPKDPSVWNPGGTGRGVSNFIRRDIRSSFGSLGVSLNGRTAGNPGTGNIRS